MRHFSDKSQGLIDLYTVLKGMKLSGQINNY